MIAKALHLGVAAGLLVGMGESRGATFRLEEATIADMQAAMEAGGLSSVELTALYLNRVLVYDRGRTKLRAVAQVNRGLFDEAAARDRQRAGGGAVGPLQGIPIVVKDSYDVAGLASAAGARPLRDLIGTKDATVVRGLRDAGAVILGKANMWAFAYAVGADPISRYAWGRARNPYTGVGDFGGSSTGSAAAAAANLCAFAMGGDTGSSIRLPSARTALVGGRPSYDLVPASGTFPTNASLDVIGPMARSVRDYATVMDVVVFDEPKPLTKFFPRASTVRPRSYLAGLRADALRGKVIGLPKPYIGKDGTGQARPLDPKIQPLWNAAVATLESLGATVKEIDWPFFHNSRRDTPAGLANGYETVGLSTVQAKLMWQWTDAYYFNKHLEAYRYAPVRSVLDLPVPTAAQDPGNFDKIAAYQRYVRSGRAKSYAAYDFNAYFAAYRRWAKRDVEDVMAAAGVDLLAFPVAGGDDPRDPDFEYLNGLTEGSFLGLPQISVPMGFAASGRPQGMMLMGRTYYSEPQILAAAYAFEQATHARRPPAATPPLPGETIAYRPNDPRKRPEIDPPVLAVEPGIQRAGSRAFRVRGMALDASGIGSVRVFVNGRALTVTRTAEDWSARISARKFNRITRPSRRFATVVVLAKDIYGNASAKLAPMRVRKDAAPAG